MSFLRLVSDFNYKRLGVIFLFGVLPNVCEESFVIFFLYVFFNNDDSGS